MFTMSYMFLTNTSSSSADAHATASVNFTSNGMHVSMCSCCLFSPLVYSISRYNALTKTHVCIRLTSLQHFSAGKRNANPWVERGIGVAVNTTICLLHAWSAKWGLRINNTMSFLKIIMLIFVCLTGLIAAAGGISGVTPIDAFSNAFEGTRRSGNEYAAAMLKVLYAYSGWNNATYIMDELKNPIRTLKVASISAISLLATLFMIANIAYFSVVPKEVLLGGAGGSSTNTIAGEFLVRIFGEKANIVMPLLIALSTFGCTSSMTYSGSRVMLEAAKEGYIPFSNFFGQVSSRHTPANILILYWVMTMLYMLAPPPGDAYNFVLNLCSCK